MECSFCSSEASRLDSHHLIPRYLNGNKEDIIEVDRKCHRKIEILTQNFLKWGAFNNLEWHDNDEHWINNSCGWCGEKGIRVFTHHFIPRYITNDSETIELCMSCHRKFESYFWNFLWWGSFKAKEWQDPEKSRLRNRKYLERHPLKQREYYEKCRERLKQKSRTYYLNNKEQCLQKMKKYRERNQDQITEHRKRWYQEHKEEDNKRSKQYHVDNRERLNESQKRYYQEHREERLAYATKYRRRFS